MSYEKKPRGRPFQPGQSGNPAGRPPLPEELKAARRMSQAEFERVANKYNGMSVDRLKKVWSNPKTKGYHRMYVGVLLKGGKGDVNCIRFVNEGLIGKVKTIVEVSGPQGAPIEARITNMTDEEIDARARELIKKALGDEDEA